MPSWRSEGFGVSHLKLPPFQSSLGSAPSAFTSLQLKGSPGWSIPSRYSWEGAESAWVVNSVTYAAVKFSGDGCALSLDWGVICTVSKVVSDLDPGLVIRHVPAVSEDVESWGQNVPCFLDVQTFDFHGVQEVLYTFKEVVNFPNSHGLVESSEEVLRLFIEPNLFDYVAYEIDVHCGESGYRE